MMIALGLAALTGAPWPGTQALLAGLVLGEQHAPDFHHRHRH